MPGERLVAVRWTIGDVSESGYEALRLSAWGAWRVFGPEAEYAVCVNSVPLDRARALAGDLPPGVAWRVSTKSQIPGFIREGLMIGPESRTSSPVRIPRHPETLESVNVPGLYPIGEGAGYSGGIVSSGADGYRLADVIAAIER